MAARTDAQKAALAASKVSARLRREEFEVLASRLADRHGWPGSPLHGAGRLPQWAVWRADDEQVVALVPAGEHWRSVDKALAFGLAYASDGRSGQRRLVLVLPEADARSTQIRAAFLAADIQIWTHNGRDAVRTNQLTSVEAQRSLREQGGLRNSPHSLGTRCLGQGSVAVGRHRPWTISGASIPVLRLALLRDAAPERQDYPKGASCHGRNPLHR